MTWSAAHLAAVHERVVTRSLRWRHFSWYWGDAIAIDGLLAAQPDVAGTAREAVVGQLDVWARTAPDDYDDVLAPGLAAVTLARTGELDAHAADRFFASLDRVPVLACGLPSLEPQRIAFRFGFCVDALYHLPSAYAALGVWRGDQDRVAAGVDIALRGVEVLTCPTGWGQWYDDTIERNNQIAWSRGVGWAVLGLVDLLAELDGSPAATRHRAQLEDLTATMLDRLAGTQEPDGNWAAVLDDELAPSETSTAAFYVAAARHPRVASISTPPASVLAAAEAAVVAAVGPDGIVTGASADILPAFAIDGYRNFACEPSPWAQGAVLRALAVMRDARGAAG
ncbi:glycoside hydrolase family 88 protein [Nocardioides sp. LHD-245]|uniref:glycoside hydrolase family 88 protein n=1 Tax=Nocardioides sp. LHD-245 TaxID=3051387 RepID=UPI0027DEC2BB|nr:glycoside hydrolase family 88 protein [Nocardioides sp. LHD-245]